MKTLEDKMSKRRLIDGEHFFFSNENSFTIEEIDCDIRVAECWFEDDFIRENMNGFKIIFNGEWHSFKTFGAFEKKLNQLIRDWQLTIVL